MNIYKLLAGSLLVTGAILRGNRPKCKGFIFIGSLLLFSVYGLRDGTKIGSDALSYLHMFQRMPEYAWGDAVNLNGGINVGFYALAKAVSEITDGDFQVLITLIAGFSTLCFAQLVYKYSPNPFASFILYLGLLLYTFQFTALKQSVAMGFLLLAFPGLVERKPFRFILLTLIASLFHFPALVFLPAYWISKMYFDRHYLIFLAAALVLTYLFRNQILNFMLRIYKDNEAQSSLSNVRFLRTKALVMLGIIISAIVFRKPRDDDSLYRFFLVFLGLAVLFQTFCGYSNIFERLADYYFVFSILLIPMVFDKKADRQPLINWRMMSVIDSFAPYLIYGFSIYRFITTVTNDKSLYPFYFFF